MMPSYANVCADGATKLDLFYFESEWQPFLCPPLLFLLIPSLTYDCLSLFKLIATSCAVQAAVVGQKYIEGEPSAGEFAL